MLSECQCCTMEEATSATSGYWTPCAAAQVHNALLGHGIYLLQHPKMQRWCGKLRGGEVGIIKVGL